MFPAQDMRVGGRQGRSQYQFTLWSSDLDELLTMGAEARSSGVKTVPGVVDVSTDREQGGLQLNVAIDRQAAARLGVRMQDIDDALNNAFAQRQISTIYTQRNQYRVILEVDPLLPARSERPRRASTCRAAAARRCRSPTWRGSSAAIAPLVVNHQGQFPAVTISFGLQRGRDAGGRDRGRAAGGARDAPARHRSRRSSPATRKAFAAVRRARSRC